MTALRAHESLESHKSHNPRLGIDDAPCIDIGNDEIEAELWEIAENLHRAELSVLERSLHIARWVDLTAMRINDNMSQKGRGRPGAAAAASKHLDMNKRDVQRAVQVASLTSEAQETAKQAGLDDNRAALLAAAREQTAERQVAILQQRATGRPTPIADDPLNDLEALEKQSADRSKLDADLKVRAAKEIAFMSIAFDSIGAEFRAGATFCQVCRPRSSFCRSVRVSADASASRQFLH